MSEQAAPTSINALLSMIEGGRMIIPDALIAEIVDFQATHAESDDVPTWYLGKLPWRGIEIPLISVEALNNDSFFRQSRLLKIIVIHGVFNREKMPYWAFVALETPRMQRIPKSALLPDEEAERGIVEVIKVLLDDESIMVPDIEKIENQIVTLLDR
jgi:chemosensory pili system protein ChpC